MVSYPSLKVITAPSGRAGECVICSRVITFATKVKFYAFAIQKSKIWFYLLVRLSTLIKFGPLSSITGVNTSGRKISLLTVARYILPISRRAAIWLAIPCLSNYFFRRVFSSSQSNKDIFCTVEALTLPNNL